MVYFVYILTNPWHTVLYTGVTNDLEQRVFEHKTKSNRGFTSKYNCDILVYFEEFGDIEEAIKREKQLKKYKRSWKNDLIAKSNSDWKDLSKQWYDTRDFELDAKMKSLDLGSKHGIS